MSNSEIAVAKGNLPQENHMKNCLEDSLFSADKAPHYMKLATHLASSEMVPKCFRGKPQDLFICWAMGYQIGLSPEQSMQCIAVINGKPSMWGDDMLALCMSHPEFVDIIEEEILDKSENVMGYTCTVKRRGREDKISKFTLDMAKKAGLLGKQGPWVQYTDRMLKLRARGFALRDAFPDALKGIKSREEVEDYIEAEFTTVDNKVSRTEFVKQQLISKRERDDKSIQVQSNDNDFGFSAESSEEENGQGEQSDNLARAERQEDGNGVQTPGAQADSNELIATIFKLLEEKMYTPERLAKALKFYEVHSIESMTPEIAADFILKLQNS